MINVTNDYLLAGKAKVTVSNPEGEHLTFRISKNKEGDKFFVSLLCGPDNQTHYQYMALLFKNTMKLYFGGKTVFTENDKEAAIFKWAMSAIDKGIVPEGYNIVHSGRCGYCAKELTHPLSIATGIGPRCREKLGLPY